MDMNCYCKHCGSVVEETEPTNGKRTYKCECRSEFLNYNEVIHGFVREARIIQLKAMHTLMCEANDEDIYMVWIYLMPDCPSEEDFIDIAISDEQYNECFDLFIKLIANKGNRY